MSFNYEYEKYLCEKEKIKETVEKYGVAIVKLLDIVECDEMIKNKWELPEHLTKNFDIPIDRNNKETYI